MTRTVGLPTFRVTVFSLKLFGRAGVGGRCPIAALSR